MHTCMHTQTHKVSSRDNPAGPHPTTKSMQCFLLGLPIFPEKVQVDTSSDEEPSQPVSRLEPGIAKWDTQVTPSELAWLIPRYYLHRNIWSRKTSEVSTVAKCKRGSKASHSPLYYLSISFHVLILSVFFQVLVALFSGALVSFGFLLFFVFTVCFCWESTVRRRHILLLDLRA